MFKWLSLIGIVLAPLIIILGIVIETRYEFNGAIIAGTWGIGLLIIAYGIVGGVSFSKRALYTDLIEENLLAHWSFEVDEWRRWLKTNRKFERVNTTRAIAGISGFIVLGCGAVPALFAGKTPVATMIAFFYIAFVLCLIPIADGIILLRKRNLPEVYISAYGVFTGYSISVFFFRSLGSLIDNVSFSDSPRPYIDINYSYYVRSNRYSSGSTNKMKKRIPVPEDSVDMVKKLVEKLSSHYSDTDIKALIKKIKNKR